MTVKRLYNVRLMYDCKWHIISTLSDVCTQYNSTYNHTLSPGQSHNLVVKREFLFLQNQTKSTARFRLKNLVGPHLTHLYLFNTFYKLKSNCPIFKVHWIRTTFTCYMY